MGFQMVCDRCGKMMRNVPAAELKKTIDQGEIVCGKCKKWEKDALHRVERVMRDVMNDLEKFKKTYKDIMLAEIQGAKPKDGENV